MIYDSFVPKNLSFEELRAVKVALSLLACVVLMKPTAESAVGLFQ